jgi:hypothetical protein
VTARILILHTAVGLEEASGLVDLVEASLPLASGDIACSSLPGYALAGGVSPKQLEGVAAALVLVDEPALLDTQLWFEAGGVWALGKRIVLLIDSPEWASQVPAQLKDAQVVVREDRAALVGLVEDLAFSLGVNPRFGDDALRVLDQLGSAPPPRMPSAGDDFLDLSDSTPVGNPVVDDTQESIALEEPPLADSFEPGPAFYAQDDDPMELSDADMVSLVPEADAPRPSHFAPRLRCATAFDAGAAISLCSFHRDSGRDFATELDDTFGRFIDAVGGNWSQLSRLSDIEVWSRCRRHSVGSPSGTRSAFSSRPCASSRSRACRRTWNSALCTRSSGCSRSRSSALRRPTSASRRATSVACNHSSRI